MEGAGAADVSSLGKLRPLVVGTQGWEELVFLAD